MLWLNQQGRLLLKCKLFIEPINKIYYEVVIMITKLSKINFIRITLNVIISFAFSCGSLAIGCPPDYPVHCRHFLIEGDWCCVKTGISDCTFLIDAGLCVEDQSSPGCSAEAIYDEYSKEAALLRYFRDNVLSQTPEGREIIKLYYQWSPVIVEAMKEDEEFKEQVKEMIDGVLLLIRTEIEE